MAKKATPTADIGLIGLAVMGQNLVLNIADHGFKVAVYNRTAATMETFVKAHPDTPGGLLGFKQLKAFVKSIKRPRKIIILVKAGGPVDAVIGQLLPLLDKEDIIVDGGNSLWDDTIRREKELAGKKIHFVGSGVSGGEEGARFGPSLMPGGTKHAWQHLKPIWTAIAAKVNKKTGKPLEGAAPGRPVTGGFACTAHIGPNGAGHYVKMVHNGIEYGDMQLICEAYFLMKNVLGMAPPEMAEVFDQWNQGDLDSFLIEITADILKQKDPANKRKWLIDSILDTAGQKGTGKWTAKNALDMGVPAASIAAAVFARCISAQKDQRVAAAKQLKGPKVKVMKYRKRMLEAIHDALYCAKICSYAQGFALMTEAQQEYQWKLNFAQIAQIWRGGCIIRAGFLQKITEAYEKNPKLTNLMLDPYFKRKMQKAQENWRYIIGVSASNGIPCPQMMSALAYFDSYRSAVLPANLLQAQRDYFGAHTYERIDQKRGKFFHVDWPKADRPQLKA